MRAFLTRVFLVVVLFTGLGGIAEKVGLYFQPEKKEVINLAKFPAPEVKIVKLDQPRQIVIRQFRSEDSADCQINIGPVLPNQFEQKFDLQLNQKVE
jgi:hypothetical protein